MAILINVPAKIINGATLAARDGDAGSPWLSPQSIREQLHVLAGFTLVLAGIATWEFMRQLHFDLCFLTGKRRFQWPVTLYLICRISMVLHVIMFAINLNTTSEIPCQPIVLVANVTDMLGTVTSSAILALRSHAVWGNSPRVGSILLAFLLIQTGLWCATFYFTNSVWEPHGSFCRIVTSTPDWLLLTVFTFTMSYDFLILVLAAYSLWPQHGYGGISTLILNDGIGYFTIAFLVNTLQTVLVALKLSSVMNLMCVPFALVTSCIAATTVFRRTSKTPQRLAKRREESFRRAGLHTSATLPQFAPPPSRATGQESTLDYGSHLDSHELSSMSLRTLPPLHEWEEPSGPNESAVKRGVRVSIDVERTSDSIQIHHIRPS